VRIALELDLDDPAVAHGGKQALGIPLKAGVVDRLHVGRRPAEVHRELSDAPGGERGQDLAVGAQGGARELRVAVARHQLLHHEDRRVHQRAGLLVAATEHGRVGSPPGLVDGQPVGRLLVGGLDKDRKVALGTREIRRARREGRPGLREPQPGGQLVRAALVIGGAQHVPGRSGQAVAP
jgi:hypothetical protein